MKELLYISQATSEVVELRVHAIKTGFNGHESFLRTSSGGIVIVFLRRQAANEMVLLSMLAGAAHEFWYTFYIACITYKEIIFSCIGRYISNE